MSFEPTDPSLLFGGTWEQIQGRFLLAASDEYGVGSTGGETTHKLTVAEMPSHAHQVYYDQEDTSRGNQGKADIVAYGTSTKGSTLNTGGNVAHNNMPPYLAVYMWQRTV